MDEDNLQYFENKYPKSKNNFQCLGPCYQPNTLVVHPITLEYVTDKDNAFCPVKEWLQADNKTGKKISKLTDTCFKPTESKSITGKELEMNIILPHIDFNCEQFLKIYYNIYTFEDAINWITTKIHAPIGNKQRVLDCAWKVYGKNIELIDIRIVDFYIDVCKKKWMRDIYNKISPYITIENDKISFIEPADNKLNSKEYSVQRTNFIIDKFINRDTIQKFLSKFVKQKQDDWEKYESHTEQIKHDLINYIENKIKKSLNSNKDSPEDNDNIMDDSEE